MVEHKILSNIIVDQQKFNVIFCLGKPGSGKNTQCELIKEKFGFSHFGTGDLLRAEANDETSELRNEINECIKKGEIVSHKITCKLARKEMEKRGKSNIFLIDGFPRNKDNLDGWLNEFNSECKIIGVIFLECSDETCTERIKQRSRNSGRLDDNEESLKLRFDVFRKETIPNIEIQLTELTQILYINSDTNDKEKIFKSICTELEKL